MAKRVKDDPSKTPTSTKEWATRWAAEFQVAKPIFTKFHKAGDKVWKVFLGDSGIKDDRLTDEQLNLFNSNTATVASILYGQLPKADVDRKFADANDDNARVAAEILERMLNQDIQAAGNDHDTIIKAVIADRLVPGLGSARLRYDLATAIQVIPATPAGFDASTLQYVKEVPEQNIEVIKEEWVDLIYTHWKDIMWSPARNHSEIRWKAYRSYMDKPALEKRFMKDPKAPKDAEDDGKLSQKEIDAIPLRSSGPLGNKSTPNATDSKSLTPQAEVWEIWNLTTRETFWFVEGYDDLLDMQDDPLELDQFWPDAPPLIANVSTNKFIPKSDYQMAQDLYAGIDVLEQRINRLTEACKLVGVYDKANDEVKRLFNESVENQLVPVDNWAMFAEKGGLEGVIQWLPIEAVTNVIEQLQNLQDRKIQQLMQITGMADVLRGASQQAYTSAAETTAKVQLSSVRLQCLQNDVALWFANLQTLKAEIICKHFQPECIAKQSGIMQTVDAPLAQAAIQWMQSDDSIRFRIRVQPESMAMADYQQMKQDRTEYMMAISQFMQSSASLVQMDQDITPFLLQLLQWGLAGFKGSQEIESVMDNAIKQFTQKAQTAAAQPKKPTPDEAKTQQIQQEGQLKLQILQAQSSATMAADKQKQEQEMERASADHQAYLQGLQFQQQIAQQKFENDMEVLKAQLVVNIAKLTAQQRADTTSTAIDMISHAEKTKMDAAADTHSMVTGAALDDHTTANAAALASHQTDQQKQAATHAAKVQAKSSDSGNGADQ